MSASQSDIARLLRACDACFIPPLSQRVDIDAYAGKLAAHARLIPAWDGAALVGLVALYCNDSAADTAFVTNVSVHPGHARRGIAGRLLREAVALAGTAGMRSMALDVSIKNAAAIALYLQHGFRLHTRLDASVLHMRRRLDPGSEK